MKTCKCFKESFNPGYGNGDSVYCDFCVTEILVEQTRSAYNTGTKEQKKALLKIAYKVIRRRKAELKKQYENFLEAKRFLNTAWI